MRSQPKENEADGQYGSVFDDFGAAMDYFHAPRAEVLELFARQQEEKPKSEERVERHSSAPSS